MKPQLQRRGVIIMVIFISLLADLCPIAASEGVYGAYDKASIPDLIEKASMYEGRRIEIEGEVIGDKMARSDGVWVEVLADGAAIGVLLSPNDASGIAALGSYARIGDRVRIQGVFHRACPDHGGDLDVHAEHVAKLAEGHATPHAIVPARVSWGIALCLSGTTLAALWRLRERRRKTG